MVQALECGVSEERLARTLNLDYSQFKLKRFGCTNTAVFTQSVSACTGLNQITVTANEINIYPNPFNDKITIISTGEKQSIEIFNVLGTLIYTAPVENGKIEIDLSQNASGIYFVKMETITKKIIKN